MKPVKIGICGLGTVGFGTFEVLQRNAEEIAARLGTTIEIVQVAARQLRDDAELGNIAFTEDVFAVANNPEVDILVELIGGYDTARELALAAIDQGKHVVTANKALIAVHGTELFERAAEKGVMVAYEAGVAGGIPVIKAIREGMSGNRIKSVAGIINGTGNFILTEMFSAGREFADVLKEAQQLGYAEADPTFDVEGIDAAHKLTILASAAFGVPLQFERAFTEGISKIEPIDLEHAADLGYRVKHLGIARMTEHGFELRVHPTLVPETQLIAKVDGVMNAVMVEGDAVGQTLYYGAGAGAEATASAVIADIVDVARHIVGGSELGVPFLGFRQSQMKPHEALPIEQVESAYYLRILAEDHPGVLARVAQILSNEGINIESIMQKEVEEQDGLIPVIILTHEIEEGVMNKAIEQIEQLSDIRGSVTRIRAEHFA